MNKVKLVKSAYEAFGKGDIPGLIGLLDDRVDWSSPSTLPQGGHFKGRQGAKGFFDSLVASWNPLSVELLEIGEVGDSVVGIVKASGQLRGGGPASYGATHVFTVDGGKIMSFREYVDVDKPLV